MECTAWRDPARVTAGPGGGPKGAFVGFRGLGVRGLGFRVQGLGV